MFSGIEMDLLLFFLNGSFRVDNNVFGGGGGGAGGGIGSAFQYSSFFNEKRDMNIYKIMIYLQPSHFAF